MNNIVDWWHSLNHNWKKNILVNFEFNQRWGNRFNEIEDEIVFRQPYNALALNFNIRAHEVLNNFVATEDTLNQLLQIKCFIVSYVGLKDLEPLQKFSKLEFLSIAGDLHGLDKLTAVENIKVLCIRGGKWKHLDCISKWSTLEEIRMTYCYHIENLTGLSFCRNLKTARLTYLGKIVNLTPLQHLQKIHIDKNQLQSDDSYYNKKFNKTIALNTLKGFTKYQLDDYEIALMEKSNNLDIKQTYNSLIKSSFFEIILNHYSNWILRRLL
jgi:hypothetical protein